MPDFGQADFLLAVAFVGFEIERAVLIDVGGAAIHRPAAIAHQGVGHHGVQQHVDQGRGEQNSECPIQLAVGPGHTAS